MTITDKCPPAHLYISTIIMGIRHFLQQIHLLLCSYRNVYPSNFDCHQVQDRCPTTMFGKIFYQTNDEVKSERNSENINSERRQQMCSHQHGRNGRPRPHQEMWDTTGGIPTVNIYQLWRTNCIYQHAANNYTLQLTVFPQLPISPLFVMTAQA